MESIEFIRELSKTVPGFIAGSYALSQLLGTPFDDIDYFVDMVNLKTSILDGKGDLRKSVSINGIKFKLHIPYQDLDKFVSYKSDELTPSVNIVAVRRLSLVTTLANFDYDILRVAMTGDFSKTDVIDPDHVRAVQRKLVGVARRTLTNDCISEIRLKKYKARLSDYEFVEYL